jgi:hypothetical protein
MLTKALVGSDFTRLRDKLLFGFNGINSTYKEEDDVLMNTED